MTTSTMTQPPARFEAARLPDGRGWTVVDLLCGTAIAVQGAWDGPTAVTLAKALDEAPGYTVAFRWSDLDSYPVARWRVLLAPVRAESLDGSVVTELPAGTTFDVHTVMSWAGLARIDAFVPGDTSGESRRAWLLDDRELRAAAAREPLQ